MDQFKQISTFVEAIGRGSLSNAARHEGVAPAIISRRLDALEERLGVKLLKRTTRKIALTDEGASYLEHCQRILTELAEAEAAISHGSQHASGHLSISAPAGFGRQHVAPLLPSFLIEHPDVSINLNLSDRVVDLVSENVDVAIRIAQLADSRLVGVKLANNQRVVCGSPKYFKKFGVPLTPQNLAQHHCLTFSTDGSQRGWMFKQGGKNVTIRVQGAMQCNDGAVLHDWAVSGYGLAWRSLWEVGAELKSGKLVAVLREFEAADNDIFAVFAARRHLPLRVRAFVDYLKRTYSATDYWK